MYSQQATTSVPSAPPPHGRLTVVDTVVRIDWGKAGQEAWRRHAPDASANTRPCDASAMTRELAESPGRGTPPPLPGLWECFKFPLSTPAGRRDILFGALLLLVPFVGWILNLGHRLDVVRRLQRGEGPYFRGFWPMGRTLWRGGRAFTAIVVYLSPSVIVGAAAVALYGRGLGPLVVALVVASVALFVMAIYVLPGGMTFNAVFDDTRMLWRPDLALRRAIAAGKAYRRAWLIALCAMACSLLGGLALGVGFLVTSVWAWSVVGYAFSRALVLPTGAAAPGDRPGPVTRT